VSCHSRSLVDMEFIRRFAGARQQVRVSCAADATGNVLCPDATFNPENFSSGVVRKVPPRAEGSVGPNRNTSPQGFMCSVASTCSRNLARAPSYGCGMGDNADAGSRRSAATADVSSGYAHGQHRSRARHKACQSKAGSQCTMD
jgi:hypothetical protein